jgi:crotonobetainyl-CoA:carnitine CoA-transferase CaiB-like acyl-CoA transferase
VEGDECLRTLIRSADVFSQGYRPGSLAARGLSPEAVAELRPGIVYLSLSAYGHVGPWRERRGYDTLVQAVTGLVDEHAEGGLPRHLPASALDYCTGYLLAFGAMVALARRARFGGSYLVRASLAQTAEWIQRLGRVPEPFEPESVPVLRPEDVTAMTEVSEGPYGHLRYLAPVVQMSETPARWARPAAPFGTHTPAWE